MLVGRDYIFIKVFVCFPHNLHRYFKHHSLNKFFGISSKRKSVQFPVQYFIKYFIRTFNGHNPGIFWEVWVVFFCHVRFYYITSAFLPVMLNINIFFFALCQKIPASLLNIFDSHCFAISINIQCRVNHSLHNFVNRI